MDPKTKWYSAELNEIFSTLQSTKEGLDPGQVDERIKLYGSNEVKGKKKDTVFYILLRQFKNFVIWVLIFAAVLSLFTNHHIEFIVIYSILGFIIVLGFFEEYKASVDMASLVNLSPLKATVIRQGKHKDVLTTELTVGDILVLRRGDIVGADARLFDANNLKIDEAILTGESLPVNKVASDLQGDISLSKQTNMVFAGTHITNGDGYAIVVEIGNKTEIGKISHLIGDIRSETTPLQKRLDILGRQLSLGAIFLAVFVFILGILQGKEWSNMLIFCMAIIVSGIPESLPSVVAVTLAAGVRKMSQRNAIIKKLPAVETLGTCTIICSDKTGTLTQNKMVIENVFTLDAEITVTGEGYEPEGLFLKEEMKIDPRGHKAVSKILEIGVLCNNADIKLEDSEWKVDGESTEGALIVLAGKAGINKEEYHNKYPRKVEHAFDPIRKCMSTIHMVNNKNFVYSKGAPENLLKKSGYYYQEGKAKKLSPKISELILEKNKEYAARGLRVLGLAYKEHRGSFELKSVETDLVFVGLVSIRDPPEPGVKESVRLCKEAGIKVVMITGDNDITAKAVASELGIFGENDTLITGDHLDKLNEMDFQKIAETISVYARVTPAHKLRIVETLQRMGHIVAMTGDGVNDAPALKKADIGIAMGKCGTDVAKETSDLILKDDNFTTIVNAVEEGRTIYENIRKFIYYLLVGNISEVLIVLIAVISGVTLPLTALMILFLNLVTSDLPALGLSVEKPAQNIMKQKPRDPKEGILSDYLLLRISEIVPIVVLGTLIIYIWELAINKSPLVKAQTIAFATIIFFELFHALNARYWRESLFGKKFFSNVYIIGGVTLSIILTLIVIYWSPLQNVFGTVALSMNDWVPILLVSSSVLFFMEIQKTLLNVEIKEKEKLQISN